MVGDAVSYEDRQAIIWGVDRYTTTVLCHGGHGVIYCKSDELEPIAVTVKMLNDMKFKEHNNNFTIYISDYEIVVSEEIGGFTLSIYDKVGIILNTDFRYLHQLQQLVRITTKEEIWFSEIQKKEA